MISKYAKFYITLLGTAVTLALALIPPTDPIWVVLTVLSGVITSALTYAVPNTPAGPLEVAVVDPNDHPII